MLDFVEYVLDMDISADFYPIIIVCGVVFSLLAIVEFNDLVKCLFGVHR